jgi:hypothetical protein
MTGGRTWRCWPTCGLPFLLAAMSWMTQSGGGHCRHEPKRPLRTNGPQEEVQKEMEYFRGNAESMRYAQFRSQGSPAPQAVLDALDDQRCQCHHRAALLPTQRSLGRILGQLCGQPFRCLPQIYRTPSCSCSVTPRASAN